MMKKFIAMVIVKPDINKEEIDCTQSNIISLFKQNAKVQMVWFLGKRKLDYKIKKYTEGYYLKIEMIGKTNKIEKLKEQLKKNVNIIFSIIMNNASDTNKLPILKKRISTLKKMSQDDNSEINQQNGEKVYMLISKNLKLPFAESNIVVIRTDLKKIYQYANKKIK